MSKTAFDTTGHVHFWGNDYRFCGSRYACREFSFNDEEVTCPHCLKKAAAKMELLRSQFAPDAVPA